MKRNNYIVYLLWLVLLLPILLLRDYTPANELRYLNIADEALLKGHLFVFTHHGEPYADKPPLYLWLLMALRRLFGGHYMVVYSALSVIPAIVVTETTANIARMDDRRRNLFRCIMASCPLFIASTVTIRMDMLMCMFIVLAMHTFLKSWQNGRREDLRLPLFIFLGVFTKGVIGVLAPLAVIIIFLIIKGRIYLFFRFLGWRSWLLLAVLSAVWLGAVYHEGGAAYLNNLVFHQTIDRAYNSFHHKEPFYYYLYMIWPLLFPWSLLVALELRRGFCRANELPDHLKYLLITAVSVFVMLSMVSAKLSIYLLPLVPCALGVTVSVLPLGRFTRWHWWAIGIPAVLMLLTFPAFAAVVLTQSELAFLSLPVLWIAAAVMSVGSGCTLWHIRKRQDVRALTALSLTIILTLSVASVTLPRINPWMGYGDACRTAKRMAEQQRLPIATYLLKHSDETEPYLGYEPQKLNTAHGTKAATARPAPCIVITPADKAHELKLTRTVAVGDLVVGQIR